MPSSGPPSAQTLAARPSVVPRAPATPPPPPVRHGPSTTFARPLTQPPSVAAAAQLEQRLGAVQAELRKLGSERHTLRARLRRETDRVHELESALRAEKELRRQASEEYQAAMAGLRERAAAVEAELQAELSRLNVELGQLRAAGTSTAHASAGGKTLLGLRRIRGIGPAYQRALEGLGVTRVEQLAAWTSEDVAIYAEKLKIRVERIVKDDWVGQAKRLDAEER